MNSRRKPDPPAGRPPRPGGFLRPAKIDAPLKAPSEFQVRPEPRLPGFCYPVPAVFSVRVTCSESGAPPSAPQALLSRTQKTGHTLLAPAAPSSRTKNPRVHPGGLLFAVLCAVVLCASLSLGRSGRAVGLCCSRLTGGAGWRMPELCIAVPALPADGGAWHRFAPYRRFFAPQAFPVRFRVFW